MEVAEEMQNRGAGTLLFEHLVSLVRSRNVHAFRAETLAGTSRCCAYSHAQVCPYGGPSRPVTMPLVTEGHFLDAISERERHADVGSLHHLLCSASVAVVGAGRRPESVGGAILRNLLSGGFSGPAYAVNPKVGERLAGVRLGTGLRTDHDRSVQGVECVGHSPGAGGRTTSSGQGA